jgi:hypothetical protein
MRGSGRMTLAHHRVVWPGHNAHRAEVREGFSRQTSSRSSYSFQNDRSRRFCERGLPEWFYLQMPLGFQLAADQPCDADQARAKQHQ